MFDEKGIVNIDKFLKEKYNYIYTDYEDLISQSFVEYEGVGANAICWFKDGDERYLFKETKDYPYTWLSEILSEEIAKILNLPCAEYRLASLGNKQGLLSKNFLKYDETLILGAQIIQEVLNKYPYLKGKNVFEDKSFINMYRIPECILDFDKDNKIKYVHNNLNNIEEIWSILDLYLTINNLSKNNLGSIINGLSKMYLFDCLTFQKDRHITNWGIISNDNTLDIKSAPFFDNAASFGLVDKNLEQRIENFYKNLKAYKEHPHEGTKQNFVSVLYKDRLLFTPSEDAITNAKYRKRQNNLDVFSYFLEVSSESSKNELFDYLKKLNDTNIINILNKIESYYNIKIEEKIFYYVADMFSYNLYFLNQQLIKKPNKRR